jgi:GTPase
MTVTLAIVGRPNVGKSTLFNRLVGRRMALVDDQPGVTRDWREGNAAVGDLSFRVLDTAGVEAGERDSLAERMRIETERVVQQASGAIFVLDARAGITPFDRDFARWLRRHGIPTILVANKAERGGGEAGVLEAYSLGLGDPVPISAEHGEGLSDLYDALRPLIDAAQQPALEPPPDEAKPLQLAVIGRPNVGKSTLVNRLIGEERVLTGPEAGITRDAIATEWRWRGERIRLIDTAGLRRRAKIEERVEQLSVADTLRAVRFAEVAVLVLDAEQMLERQDLSIARQVEEEGRALVLAVNKWDLVEDKEAARRKLRERIEESLPQLQGLAAVMLSAKTGRGVERLMPAIRKAYDTWNRRIATPPLNRWLAAAQAQHPPPLVSGRRLRIRYMTQANIRPPTFALFASKPSELPDSYRRYLVNLMRRDFDLPGVPIRMMLRGGKNPYAEKK